MDAVWASHSYTMFCHYVINQYVDGTHTKLMRDYCTAFIECQEASNVLGFYMHLKTWRIRAWFHNQTKINLGPYGRLT